MVFFRLPIVDSVFFLFSFLAGGLFISLVCSLVQISYKVIVRKLSCQI